MITMVHTFATSNAFFDPFPDYYDINNGTELLGFQARCVMLYKYLMISGIDVKYGRPVQGAMFALLAAKYV